MKSIETFKERFLTDKSEYGTPTYEIYAAAAKELWEVYSDKYELIPRSVVNVSKGKNRGVIVEKDGERLMEISIGMDTTIYMLKTILTDKLPLDYNIDQKGKYRYTFQTFEECREAIKKVL